MKMIFFSVPSRRQSWIFERFMANQPEPKLQIYYDEFKQLTESDWNELVEITQQHERKRMDAGQVGRRFDPLGSAQEIKETVTYHAPTEEQLKAIDDVREVAMEFLVVLKNHVPACADRTAAVRKIREAMMTANAAIVLGGKI